MTELAKKLGIDFPLIVAPMAGGPSTPELVISSSEAGALGSIGAAYSTGPEIERFFKQVQTKTQKPVAINLFISQGEVAVTSENFSKAIEATQKFRDELALPVPKLEPPFENNFEDQFETVLKIKPAVLSFIFGLLKPEMVKAVQKSGIYLMGTATSLEEAQALEDSGVDAITLQGYEAGGHRALFDSVAEDPKTLAFDLLKKCHSKIKIPLILAGGIMTSQDIKEALAHGADAVQMGTAFLDCLEAGTSEPYRRALRQRVQGSTRTTRAFSGRWARGIENRFMHEMDRHPKSILPFPAQNKFTRDIRNASTQRNSSDFLSLWSGAGHGELWRGSARELIQQLFANHLI